MSFYAIIDTKYFDESFLDPDIGIFNEDGIKEAKKQRNFFMSNATKESLVSMNQNNQSLNHIRRNGICFQIC